MKSTVCLIGVIACGATIVFREGLQSNTRHPAIAHTVAASTSSIPFQKGFGKENTNPGGPTEIQTQTKQSPDDGSQLKISSEIDDVRIPRDPVISLDDFGKPPAEVVRLTKC